MRTHTTMFSLLLLAGMTLLLTGCGGPDLFDYVNNAWSLGCCGTLVLILDIIALIEVAGSPRTLANKVLWAVVIIFAPVLGCILYYFFGR